MSLSFKTTKEELHLINQIVDRVEAIYIKNGWNEDPDLQPFDRMEWFMDISATNASGCKLKLQQLLEADNFNFSHDVFGIRRHINRDNGQLENCFLPRFADIHIKSEE